MNIFNMIPTIMMVTAPILITAIGGMICERSGVVNVALEGLMSIGACAAACSAIIIQSTGAGGGSVWVGVLIAMVVSGVISLIHAVAAIDLKANQTISGTGINLLADGITIFACQVLFGMDRTDTIPIRMQTDGLGFYPSFYIAIVVVALSWFVLYKTPFGMHLRACGEHPAAADSVGINVRRVRYIGVFVSGVLAGLAGSCAVMTQTTQFTSTLIGGRGFIALAAVAFGRWTPLGVLGASVLFGASQALSVLLSGTSIPSEVFNIIPYAITLIALIAFSGKDFAPRSAGIPYEKSSS
ncbi:MAG: ABC transporter permease [Sphaerochaetaceae bacterium]|nr:ABC transporter permease [Sphaerochaetaceae bacterium]